MQYTRRVFGTLAVSAMTGANLLPSFEVVAQTRKPKPEGSDAVSSSGS